MLKQERYYDKIASDMYVNVNSLKTAAAVHNCHLWFCPTSGACGFSNNYKKPFL